MCVCVVSVDVTPPVVVTAPTFLSLSPTTGDVVTTAAGQVDRSLLTIAWRFSDPDTSLLTHTLSVSGSRQSRHGLEPTELVVPDDRVTLQLKEGSLLTDGDLYTATVTACNAAGLCATAVSEPLLVDSTPPVVGKFDPLMAWAVRRAESPGDEGLVTSVVVGVSWSGFADAESGVKGYHLTAGRTYGGQELSGGGSLFVAHDEVSLTQNFSLDINGTLRSGELLVFGVWAENALGLISPVLRVTFQVLLQEESSSSSSPPGSGEEAGGSLVLQRHSCTPHFCSNECTCAAFGQTCRASGGTAAPACRDLSDDDSLRGLVDLAPRLGCASCKPEFITSATCLEGHWALPEVNPSVTISRFQWSFSLANESAGIGVLDTGSQPVWYDSGLRTSAAFCLPAPGALSAESGYVLHVRAWLTPDSYVTRTSAALVADHSPPVRRRGRSVKESDDASCSARDVDFFGDGAVLTACWAGVFSDGQSGVRGYEVWVGTVPFGKSAGTFCCCWWWWWWWWWW